LSEIYIFDACALIALLSKENGYMNVENILERSRSKEAVILMHTVNLLEVYYHISKLYNDNLAQIFLMEIKKSPIRLRMEVTDDVIIRAGRLKRQYRLSLADAVGLAETIISGGAFVTSDHHELDVVEKKENIKFVWIR
jgi:PIN domain nuclease of toxin-antitoxin system